MGIADSFKNKNWADYKGNAEYTVYFKAGIRLVKIVEVIDKEDDGYLEVFVDVVKSLRPANEDFKDYFFNKAKDKLNSFGETIETAWDNAGKIRLYYENRQSSEKDEKTKNLFKARITAIEECNEGYNFEEENFDPQSLVGKYVVGVWRAEEYIKRDGNVGTTIKLLTFRSIEAFENGDVAIPEKLTIDKINQKTYKQEEKKPTNFTKYNSGVSQPTLDPMDDIEIPDFDFLGKQNVLRNVD